MQLDMHFYGIYALARASGLDPETAKTLAYASQFVDDAIDDEHVVVANNRAIVPTMTSHKPIDYQNAIPGDQWKIWVPFHFLPGNDPQARTFVERMVCEADSGPANQMFLDALDVKNEAFWPHLIGIVSHVYADTFSHFGFVGFASHWNRANEQKIEILNVDKKSGIFAYIRGKFEEFKARFLSPLAELIPVGHGAVATFPDRPYLEWRFQYETHKGKVKYTYRNNPKIFLKACEKLYSYFRKYMETLSGTSNPKPNKTWLNIKEPVKMLLEYQAPCDERIAFWKRSIANGIFCPVTDLDRTLHYDEALWKPKNVANEQTPGQEIRETNACKYIRAAWKHRNYVLHELLPKFDIIVY